MSKKQFIALADAIIESRRHEPGSFQNGEVEVLASFCRGQNGAFKRERWLEYIDGTCGPNGGPVPVQADDESD